MSAQAPGMPFGAPMINLMPRAELERRARASLVRRWAWGLVAALAVVALAGAGALSLRLAAEMRLAAENVRTHALLAEMAALSDVRAAVMLERELAAFGTEAMVADLDWPGLVAKILDVTPEGATVVGFDLAAGAIPVGDDPALEVGAIGTFSFESATPVDMVPLIRAVRTVPGVIDADGWELTSEDSSGGMVYMNVLRVSFDQSAYTNAYQPENGE
jgi:hypothetical protein